MKEWLMGYLTFSRKERIGVMVLLGLILTIWLLPKYYLEQGEVDESIIRSADSLAALKVVDSTSRPVKPFKLFYFDPNTITDAEWEMLGLRIRTIATIRNFLTKGGRFRRPGDLAKIYGLKPEEAARLIPYVKIAGERQADYRPSYKPFRQYRQPTQAYRTFERSFEKRKPVVIDVNTADSAAFESLPGIGGKLATRIIRFRESLGGFQQIEQVREVYGINDTVYNLIAASLTLGKGVFRKIRINDWDTDSLNLHPYIQKHEAKAIVKYRVQHGRFREAKELAVLGFVTDQWLHRILPYLAFD